MTDFEKELKAYQKRIRRLLLVKTAASKRFLAELDGNMRDYAEQSGAVRPEQIEERFGTPEQIAKDFFAQTDIETVRRRLALRRGITAAVLAALLVWSVAVGALYLEGKNDMNGTFSEQTAVSEVTAQ